MKRFILSLALIPVLGFGINVFAQDEVVIWVDENNSMQLESSGIGSIHQIGSEYYVFAPGKVHLKRKNPNEERLKVGAPDENSGALFFNTPDGQPIQLSSINNDIYLGMAEGNYPMVKFKIGSKYLFLCNPKFYQKTITDYLLNAPKFEDPRGSLKGDTLTVFRTDTLEFLKVSKPKYSEFKTCKLNGTKLTPTNPHTATVKDEAYLQMELKSHWSTLKNGDKLEIQVNLISDNGVFDHTVTQTYTINVIEPSKKTPIWLIVLLCVVGAVALALIIAFIIYSYRKKKTSDVVTDTSADEPTVSNVVEEAEHKDEEAEKTEEETVAPSDTEEVPLEVTSDENKPEVEEQGETDPAAQSVDYDQKIADLEKQLNDKAQQIARKEEEIADLQRNVKDYSHKLDKLESRINEYQREVNAKQNKIDNLQATIESKDGIINSKDIEIKNAQNSLNLQRDKIERLQNEHQQQVESMQKDHIQQVEDMQNYHSQKINELNSMHEAASRDLQDRINALQYKINETVNSWDNDKKSIVEFFARYVEKIDRHVNVVLEEADQDSPAYVEISQMADSMNGYLAFKTKALEIISKTDLPINEIESQISALILDDVKYEKSWFNTIARLYAYSQVDELQSAFGYYDNIADDMKAVFRSMENLSELFGITDINVPKLFKDEFTSKKFDYKNTNLVLPQIYPTYVEMLMPMAVYDFSIVGYSHDGVTNKPVVAYNTKN